MENADAIQRMAQQLDEVIRSLSELMTRQNATDLTLANLIAQNTAAGTPTGARHPNGHANGRFYNEESNPVNGERLRSSKTEGGKPVRLNKLYLQTTHYLMVKPQIGASL